MLRDDLSQIKKRCAKILAQSNFARPEDSDSAEWFAVHSAAQANFAIQAREQGRIDDAISAAISATEGIFMAELKAFGIERVFKTGLPVVAGYQKANLARSFEAGQGKTSLLTRFDRFERDHGGPGSSIRAFAATELGKTSDTVTGPEYDRYQKAIYRAKRDNK